MTQLISNRPLPKTPPTPKLYNFGFVILCPMLDRPGMRNTVESIRHIYPKSPVLGVVGSDASAALLADFNEVCPTVQGKDTITSLINTGMKHTEADWNVIVFAGSWLRPSLYRQFDCFVKEEKDILFQVVDGHTNFVDGCMNGIVIHKKTFAEVGDFPESKIDKPHIREMELLKLIWAMNAIEKGCRFKAIIGMRVA